MLHRMLVTVTVARACTSTASLAVDNAKNVTGATAFRHDRLEHPTRCFYCEHVTCSHALRHDSVHDELGARNELRRRETSHNIRPKSWHVGVGWGELPCQCRRRAPSLLVVLFIQRRASLK